MIESVLIFCQQTLFGIPSPYQSALTPLSSFPAAHVPLFLYPFLNTTSKTRPFEYLRLTSLGVIGALVKVRWAGTVPLPWCRHERQKLQKFHQTWKIQHNFTAGLLTALLCRMFCCVRRCM